MIKTNMTNTITKPICCLLFSMFVAAAFSPAMAQQTMDVLPFEVIIDGQTAMHSEAHKTVGTIPEPIPASAEIALPASAGQVIVNAFPSDANGETSPTAQAKILLFNADDNGRLNKTVDGSQLASGYHLLNIMAGGKTARVLIQIE